MLNVPFQVIVNIFVHGSKKGNFHAKSVETQFIETVFSSLSIIISSHVSIVSFLVICNVIVIIVHCCVVPNRCVSLCSVNSTICVQPTKHDGIDPFNEITIAVNVDGLTPLHVLSGHAVNATTSPQNVAPTTSTSVIHDNKIVLSPIHKLNSFILFALLIVIVNFGFE